MPALTRLISLLALRALLPLVAVGSAFAQGSDSCGAAQTISGTGLFAFDNSVATTDGAPDAACISGQAQLDQIERDVWFAWTAPSSGDFVFSTCGITSIDSKLAIYLGTSCPTGPPLACVDDSCGLQTAMPLSGAVAGQDYMLRVGSFPGTAGGVGDVDIQPGTPVPNDACMNAMTISGTGNFPFDNTFATTDGLPHPSCVSGGAMLDQITQDLWYAWTAPANGNFAFSTCNLSSVDTKLALYAGVACPTGPPLVCVDDTCALQTQLVLTGAVQGAQYLLRVGSYPLASGGSGSFDISSFSPPGNDDCANATPIPGLGTYPFTNVFATDDGAPDTLCDFFGQPQIHSDVWFAWTAPSSGNYVVRTCGFTALDTKLAAYSAPCPVGAPLACNDDACALQSQISLTAVVGGDQMLIRVGSFSPTAQGSGEIEIEQTSVTSLGTSYCMALVNSSGQFGSIAAFGSASVGAADLSLEATGLPGSVFGIFYFGSNTLLLPFGDGFRCVGGMVFRLPFDQADASGLLLEPDVFAHANAAALVPGSTWNFQGWFRDPSGPGATGFNLTNGVTIPFVP